MIVPNSVQTPAAVAAHYNELDRFYREVWGEHVHHGLWRTGRETPETAVEQLVRFLAGELGLSRGQPVCDVGCGYGASAELLAREYGARVAGVTISRVQFERASQRAASVPGLTFQCRDWLDNRFTDESFDAIYAIESTEHMADKQRFFLEAFRTLRPGGRLAVYAWLSYPDPSPWQVKRLLEPICREGRLAGMGTAAEYRGMAEAAGFDWRAEHDLSRQVSRTWSICISRFLGKLASDRSYRRYMADRSRSERIFALTVVRILAAYRLGAMQYALLVARKP
jgi:tocopherol O-methyltransferase